MTLEDFLKLFREIRDQIVERIKENTDPSSTVVFNRDVFDEEEAVWLGRLTAPDGSIHCWSVFYTGCAGLDDPENAVATETFVPTFRLVGYRGYDFGTNVNNSSDKHLDELNTLRWKFMHDPKLSITDNVNQHTGFIDQTVLGKIDTKPVHISRIDLGVQLHPIPYELPS